MVALNKSLTTAARAATDGTTKDILKQAKSALNDKSMALQRAAADVRAPFIIIINVPPPHRAPHRF